MKNLTYCLNPVLLAQSGCDTGYYKDSIALNCNLNADRSKNGTCRFSSVPFYTESSTFEELELEKITKTSGIKIEPIGEITSFNQPYRTPCGESETVLFDFGQSAVPKIWSAALEHENGGLVDRSGDFEPDPNEECVRIDVMPH